MKVAELLNKNQCFICGRTPSVAGKLMRRFRIHNKGKIGFSRQEQNTNPKICIFCYNQIIETGFACLYKISREWKFYSNHSSYGGSFRLDSALYLVGSYALDYIKDVTSGKIDRLEKLSKLKKFSPSQIQTLEEEVDNPKSNIARGRKR